MPFLRGLSLAISTYDPRLLACVWKPLNLLLSQDNTHKGNQAQRSASTRVSVHPIVQLHAENPARIAAEKQFPGLDVQG